MKAKTSDPGDKARSVNAVTKTHSGVWQTFGWAFEGMVYAFRTQRNVKIHCAITLGVCLVSLWLGLPGRDWVVLILLMGMVFAAEFINTAIEAVVDLVSPAPHPLAKAAKDTAAAAVLTLAIVAVIIGILLIAPPLLTRLGLLG